MQYSFRFKTMTSVTETKSHSRTVMQTVMKNTVSGIVNHVVNTIKEKCALQSCRPVMYKNRPSLQITPHDQDNRDLAVWDQR